MIDHLMKEAKKQEILAKGDKVVVVINDEHHDEKILLVGLKVIK
jgi:hypothetical protein